MILSDRVADMRQGERIWSGPCIVPCLPHLPSLDANLDDITRPDLPQRNFDSRNQWCQIGEPICRSDRHDNRDSCHSQVLLKLEVLVDREQNLEALACHQGQQLSILLA